MKISISQKFVGRKIDFHAVFKLLTKFENKK